GDGGGGRGGVRALAARPPRPRPRPAARVPPLVLPRRGAPEGGGGRRVEEAGRGAPRAMKTLIVVAGGAADRPQEELGGRTPLEAAQTPMLDRLAREGRLGRMIPVPEGFRP